MLQLQICKICFTIELGESAGGDLLDAQALLLGDAGGEAKALDAAADADAGKRHLFKTQERLKCHSSNSKNG